MRPGDQPTAIERRETIVIRHKPDRHAAGWTVMLWQWSMRGLIDAVKSKASERCVLTSLVVRTKRSLMSLRDRRPEHTGRPNAI